jgi:hypothetical protein
MRWSEVAVTGDGLIARFLKLTSTELTSLSARRTEGRGILAIANPFSFRVALEGASYRLRVNGEELGGGAARGRTLRAKRTGALELPFSAEEQRFRVAAGPSWFVGASVPVELSGSLLLRLPSGEFAVPLEFSGRMGTDGARSGVFSHPDGGSSLSPNR